MKPGILVLLTLHLLSFQYGTAQTYKIKSAPIIYGKLYYQSKGNSPAANVKVVLMPNTKDNLQKAQNFNNTFDDNAIKQIPDARVATTSNEGVYQFSKLRGGTGYILRVTGFGGMYYQFFLPANYSNYLIPDLPTDYYNYKKRLPVQNSRYLP